MGTENEFEMRIFKVKNTWKIQVEARKETKEDGSTFLYAKVYRIKEDGKKGEEIEGYTMGTHKCDNTTMIEKIHNVLSVVKATGDAVGACTSAIGIGNSGN